MSLFKIRFVKFTLSGIAITHNGSLETLEYKQITTDQKVEKLYEKLEEGKLKPKQGIFYDGQVGIYDQQTAVIQCRKL